MTATHDIEFLLNDQRVRLASISPAITLLDWLRENPRMRGTKEGCAEGDCGACTVLVERLDLDGAVERRAVTSCLLSLGQIDGCSVRTIEGVGGKETAGHHLQEVMANNGATQCGFCTPGFVMSGVALLHRKEVPTLSDVHDAIAGNLCRCTGYRPIVEAIQTAATKFQIGRPAAHIAVETRTLVHELSSLREETAGPRHFAGSGFSFHAPTTIAELLRLRSCDPQALLIAGGSDLGLLASRDRRPPPSLISLAKVKKLQEISEDGQSISIGAAVSYSDAAPSLCRHWPELSVYLSRLGSEQIRAVGTIGGNLGTASPIGDFLPVLIALGADVLLASERGERMVPTDDFLIGYRRSALADDEIVTAVRLPLRRSGDAVSFEKLSRRRDQDISTLTSAFRIRLADEKVADCAVAFGGMADRVVRAKEVEQALVGQPLTSRTFRQAAEALNDAFAPQDDLRATASYRRKAAQNLLARFWLKLTSPATPIELDRIVS